MAQAGSSSGAAETTPYEDGSARGMKDMLACSVPIHGWQAENFLHRMAPGPDGMSYAALVNESLHGGVGVSICCHAGTLPYVSHWKMVGESDYVVALEPCNVPCLNRAELRQRKLLPFLEPGEKREMSVEVGILCGRKEIAAFQARAGRGAKRSPS